MAETMKNEKYKSAIAVAAVGFLFVIGLFFWYKSFAYYTHDIHTYDLKSISEDGQMVFSLDRLKNHYETVIQNNSASEITAAVYLGGSNPVLLQENIQIFQGEEYWFDSSEYEYQVLISGEEITEDNINVKASTLNYLKKYRQSVIFTMIVGIALTFLWTALVLAAPGQVKKYGVKINMIMSVLLAVASVCSCLIFFKGYLESNLCFLALLCAMFTTVLKQGKKEISAVKPEEAFLTAGLLSMVVSCLIFNLMLNSTETSFFYIFNSRNKMSLPDYAITVVIFFALFLVFSVAFLKDGRIVALLKSHMDAELAVCGITVLFSFLVQQESLGMAGNLIYFICVLLMLAVLYILYDKTYLQRIRERIYHKSAGRNISMHKLKDTLVYVSYAIAIAVTAISTTVINYFHMGGRTNDYVHHVSTYFRPVYYIINHIPAEGGVEIYGHYAWLYKIPIEIFGANLVTVGIFTGMIGGLTALFAVCTIHMLTDSRLLRIVGAAAVMNVLCYKLYLAIIPHRLLFPMMLLFYIVWCEKRPQRWLFVLMGFMISLIAIFWNTETGAVVLITWVAYLLFRVAMKKEWNLGYMLRMAAAVIGIIMLAAVVVTGIFVLYYVMISKITMADALGHLFGVLLSPGYMFSAHFNFIRWTNEPWIYCMIFLLAMAAYGIAKTGLLGGSIRKKSEAPMVISIAVMGLGQMIYFISRPEDYSIMIFSVIFCMIYLLDKIRREAEVDQEAISKAVENVRSVREQGAGKIFSLYKRLLGIVLLFGLSCILVQSKDVCEGVWQRCISNHQLDYELLKEDLTEFAEQVPEDTYIDMSRHEGLAVVYFCLGWVAPQEKENAEYMMTGFMVEDAEYDFVEAIPFGDMEFYLYHKRR